MRGDSVPASILTGGSDAIVFRCSFSRDPIAVASPSAPSSAPPSPLLDETQAADRMSISPRTLQAWRARRHGPAFLRIGSRIRYCPQALDAWMAAQRAVAAPRKSRPVTLAHRPVLSERMAGLIAREIAGGFAGEVHVGATAYRRLAQALRPIEVALALALCPAGRVHPDGTVRLDVPHNVAARDPGLDPGRRSFAVSYDPRSGRWTSEAGAGQPGFDDFCAHVWRIQGRREGLAARNLLAFVGAAYLTLLSEGQAA